MIGVSDSGVAESLKDYLVRHPEIESQLNRSKIRQYFTTGDPNVVKTAARQITGLNPEFKKVDLSCDLG